MATRKLSWDIKVALIILTTQHPLARPPIGCWFVCNHICGCMIYSICLKACNKSFTLTGLYYACFILVPRTIPYMFHNFFQPIPQPVWSHVTHWSKDPHIGMACTYIPVGKDSAACDVLAQDVEEKVYFAGEVRRLASLIIPSFGYSYIYYACEIACWNVEVILECRRVHGCHVGLFYYMSRLNMG